MQTCRFLKILALFLFGFSYLWPFSGPFSHCAMAFDFVYNPIVVEEPNYGTLLGQYPWQLNTLVSIIDVTDNDVDDKAPSLNNGYAFWYQVGTGIMRWETDKSVSSAGKVADGGGWTISSYDGKVAYSFITPIRYWDGHSVSIVDKDGMEPSLYDDSIAYAKIDSNGINIVIKKGITETQITNTNSWDLWPSLYNNTVAWQGSEDGDDDIYYWDGQTTRKITQNNEGDMHPSLYDGKIAWYGFDGNDYEIYYWNGTSILQLTNDTEKIDDEYPSLYDGKIAWQRKTANGYEIFYWDGNTITQITSNNEDDKAPCLYNGAIIWQHWDGHDWEIQYAEVDVPVAPTVATLAATDITQHTANINGSVNPNGQDTTYHFEWGTSSSYGHVTPNKDAGSGNSAVNVYEGLTGLTPGTTYHYRIVAINPSGNSTGQDQTFSTTPIVVMEPTVSTGDAENVMTNSARLTGTVNPSGISTQYRFEYGSNSTTYGSHTAWMAAGNGSSDLSVAMDIAGLTPATTYHYRLVAKNAGGTVEGEDKTFTTLPVADPMEDTARRFTGWWYTKSQQGTGLAVEIKGGKLYAAWFVYDESGRSVWYASGGPLTSDTVYTGDLKEWTGWPWGEAYSPPPSRVVGNMTLIFNKGSQDTITFSASVNGKTAYGTLSSFMKDFAPGNKDPRNLNGWWWDPAYDGMGFFFDVRGGKMAMVWYNYREDRSPRWWTSYGPLSEGATNYNSVLDGWQGGQAPGESYRQPQKMAGEGGPISITFTDANHATLTVGSTTLQLQRFDF